MSKVGRPKKVIDYKLVKKLANIFCTQEEIANIIDVSLSSLQHNPEFLQVYKKELETAKSSLRRNQFKLSTTNAGMAIWLGKQYLGQKEPKEEIDINIIDLPTNIDDLSNEEIENLYAKLTNKHKTGDN